MAGIKVDEDKRAEFEHVRRYQSEYKKGMSREEDEEERLFNKGFEDILNQAEEGDK
jgi:hypothetical protein